MAVEAAPLDQSRWNSLWHRLGAYGNGLPVFTYLVEAYAEPNRAYHNADHIRACLTQLDETELLAERPEEVEAALWFHDAVYVPGAGDNEERSAALAREALAVSAVSLDTTQRIAALVLATRHVTLPDTQDARLLCDIDLAILGSTPEEYDDFERRIRKEYSRIPDILYRPGRAEILSGFLRRRFIYQTEHYRSIREVPARQNLHRAIAQLTG